MALFARPAVFLRRLLNRSRVERDLDAELSAYVAHLTDEHVRAGMTPDDARR